MACISTHLHDKPYQVALSPDKDVIYRKWNHIGTTWCVSGLEAAFRHGVGELIATHSSPHGVIYQFAGGCVHVGFGS